jgi:hypothetical protein
MDDSMTVGGSRGKRNVRLPWPTVQEKRSETTGLAARQVHKIGWHFGLRSMTFRTGDVL